MTSIAITKTNEISRRNLPSVRLLEAGRRGNFTQALSSAEVRLAFAKRSGEARQDEGGLNQRDKLQNAGITEVIRLKFLNIALKSNLKFTAPPTTATMPDRIDFQELKIKWGTIRSSFKQVVDDYLKDFSSKRIMKHPIDHHRVQIEDLINNFSKKVTSKKL